MRDNLIALRIRVIFAGVVLCLLPSGLTAQEHQPPTLLECAQLVMTEVERKALDGLPAAEQEARASAYWAERDPTPGTPANELVEVIRRRAARADRLLGTDAWRGDRGRVFLVKGLPLEIERRAPVPGEPAPEIIWRYRARPTAAAGTTVETDLVRFDLRDGEYVRVETTPPITLGFDALMASVREELALQLASGAGAAYQGMPAPTVAKPIPTRPRPETEAGAGGEAPDAAATAVPPGPAAGLDREVAPEVRIWMEMVFGGVMRDELDMRQRRYVFPTREGTYTALAFDLATSDLRFVDPAGSAPAAGVAGVADELASELGEPGTSGSEVAQGESAEETEAQAAAATEAEAAAAIPPGTTSNADRLPLDSDDLVVDAMEADRLLGPRAKLRVFGAFLQGAPGSEDTIHAFVVPFYVMASDQEEGAPRTPMRSIGVTLAPGQYRVAWGVLDENSGRAVTFDEIIDIPAYSENELSVTRPILARLPHEESALAFTADETVPGIRLGRLVLEANLDNRFARDDAIDVITLVGGWAPDPAQPGKPILEVEYRIVDIAGDVGRRVIARLPTQSVDFAVLSQQIPLQQVEALVPGGQYLIEVRIKDLVEGSEVSTSVPFQVAETMAAEGASESR